MALRMMSRLDGLQLTYLRSSQHGKITVVPVVSSLLLKKDSIRFHMHKNYAALMARYFHMSAVRLVQQGQTTQNRQEIAKAQSRGEVTTAKKVVQAGKDFTYLGFIVLGLGITVVLFYTVGNELLSSQTPQGVFSTALKRIKNNEEVCDELGDPIKGHGERTKRGYSRHVSNMQYEKDGVEYMRLQFYLKGSIRSGTAHAEVKKDESGKWEFRYLFVESDKYPHKTIVIEDNR